MSLIFFSPSSPSVLPFLAVETINILTITVLSQQCNICHSKCPSNFTPELTSNIPGIYLLVEIFYLFSSLNLGLNYLMTNILSNPLPIAATTVIITTTPPHVLLLPPQTLPMLLLPPQTLPTRFMGELAVFWERLFDAGYRVVSIEPNDVGGVHSLHCVEFTVVRTIC